MSKTLAAGIFLVRKNGTLLVCHPTHHKADFWSIPKGKLDDNETPEAAAIRECFEESNISLTFNEKSLIALDPVNYGHKKKMLYPFLCLESMTKDLDWDKFEVKCNSNVPLERGGFPEMDDFKWVPIEEARPLLHETQVACLDKVKAFYENNNV